MIARVRTALRSKTSKPQAETAVIHIFELEIHPSDMLNLDLAGEPIGNYLVKVQFSDDKEEVVKILLQ